MNSTTHITIYIQCYENPNIRKAWTKACQTDKIPMNIIGFWPVNHKNYSHQFSLSISTKTGKKNVNPVLRPGHHGHDVKAVSFLVGNHYYRGYLQSYLLLDQSTMGSNFKLIGLEMAKKIEQKKACLIKKIMKPRLLATLDCWPRQ